MAEDIKIIHVPSEDEPFAVIDKPRFLPSAPLYEGDDSAFTRAAAVYPFLLGVNGKKPCEHGLLHRIDTLTSGLLLIASTQAAYERLSAAQDSGLFVKTYRAVCRRLLNEQEQFGFAPLPQDFNTETFLTCKQNYTVKSKFRPFSVGSKEVRPVTEFSGEAAKKKACGREYTTTINIEKIYSYKTGSGIEVYCSINSGYRHQVRCHLAWSASRQKRPLYDPCYNPDCTPEESFDFSAVRIEFPNPVTGKKEVFSLV